MRFAIPPPTNAELWRVPPHDQSRRPARRIPIHAPGSVPQPAARHAWLRLMFGCNGRNAPRYSALSGSFGSTITYAT